MRESSAGDPRAPGIVERITERSAQVRVGDATVAGRAPVVNPPEKAAERQPGAARQEGQGCQGRADRQIQQE